MATSRKSLLELALMIVLGASPCLGQSQTQEAAPPQTPTPQTQAAPPGAGSPGITLPPMPQIPQVTTQSGPAQSLTLPDAQNIAIQNHPQIQAASQLATAAKAQFKEVQSAYYPQSTGDLTGADAETGSRIGAGALNSSTIYNKGALGLSVNQLVTDFGRTHELSKSANLHAQAQQENVVTTRADVLLGVNAAYFDVLRAQAVLRVAQQTVQARQLVADQISELAKSNLRSGLDVSFADVDLAKAQLLLVRAQNDLESSYAQMSRALGYPDSRTYTLAEEPIPGAPPATVQPLIQEALQNRPEIISQGLDVRSAQDYATAQRDLWFPTVDAIGISGLIPYRESPLPSRYAAAGFNVTVPIFNGKLFNEYHIEALARSRAQQQNLRDLQDRISQDVRKAWLDVITSYQNVSLTAQLVAQTTQAVDLAQARYNLGLSSIIELSQAQLNLTQAQIDNVSAQYDYEYQNTNLNYQLGRLR